MKSQKAKEFLDKPSGDWLWVSQHKQKAIEAVELAEAELEEKYEEELNKRFYDYIAASIFVTKDKAVEAFCKYCTFIGEQPCDGVCDIKNRFINELNN